MSQPIGKRGGGYGLDAELAKKQAEKYDPQAELMAKNWIENVTNESFSSNFSESLKNGQLLCKLMNKIKPGSIKKIETSNMPFKQMENISNFLKAARTVGIAEYELFETVDLYEEKDLGSVVRCIHALSRAVQRNVPTFHGPYLDPTFQSSGNNLSPALAAVSLETTQVAAPAPPPRPRSPVPSAAAIAATILSPSNSNTPSSPPPLPPSPHGLNSTSATLYQPHNNNHNHSNHSTTNPQPYTPGKKATPTTTTTTSSSSNNVSPAAPPPKPAKPTTTTTNTTTTSNSTSTSSSSGASSSGTSGFGARGAGFGLDAELAKKQAAKYDVTLEREAKEWIEAVTGERFGNESFASKLKNGEVLCKLINCIQPNTIKKINNSTMPFKQMENITAFLRSCRTLGVSEHDLFETVDLYEEKDLNVVVQCIFALGRTIQTTVPQYTGPTLGPRLASTNRREFSEEQLAKARAEAGMTKIMAGSKDHMERSHISTANNVTFGADTVGTGDSGSINALNLGSVNTMDRTHISQSGNITFGHDVTK